MKHRAFFAISLLALTACTAPTIEASGPCAGGVFIGTETDLLKQGLLVNADYVSPPSQIFDLTPYGVPVWIQNETTYVPIYWQNRWIKSTYYPGEVHTGKALIALPRVAQDIELCVDSTTHNYYSRK